jgi:RNA recognition motif-containing protein
MKIYVSNISWGLNTEELHGLFAEFGEVASANIIKDKATGKSRGFGFVEMDNNDEANAAINALNGTDQKGRPINVAEARPRD